MIVSLSYRCLLCPIQAVLVGERVSGGGFVEALGQPTGMSTALAVHSFIVAAS